MSFVERVVRRSVVEVKRVRDVTTHNNSRRLIELLVMDLPGGRRTGSTVTIISVFDLMANALVKASVNVGVLVAPRRQCQRLRAQPRLLAMNRAITLRLRPATSQITKT